MAKKTKSKLAMAKRETALKAADAQEEPVATTAAVASTDATDEPAATTAGADEATDPAPDTSTDQEPDTQPSDEADSSGNGNAGGDTADDDTAEDDADAGGNTITKMWYSGNITSKNTSGGVTLQAEYVLGADDKFETTKLTFTDYSLDDAGVSSTIPALKVSDDWVDVPQPSGQSNSAGDVNPETGDAANFTISGRVQIASRASGKFLWIQFEYGPEDQEQDERGWVFDFGPDSAD